jgi:hypothetical protein
VSDFHRRPSPTAQNETGYAQRKPVLTTLAHLAEAATGVIKLFND